ncbi:MAG TPA: BolA family transcriptional regulator [Candidatus Paenalcaligenes intestinipullorum]|uniref:BolA family transcriptional regulator n=1 Tax=Candidatus Paenalcaligenes intestinipullorum TaxID=2838718 RepID=A0A9D2U7L4_9BURK|nr:BolA family transcriptional regulator [Candidatus Paenalcaligenes intestinipullorum]
MLPTPELVHQYIADNLNCEHIEVTGDGAHFEALIVSPAFAGKRAIARHQIVYKALGDRILGNNAEIHALSMRTLTPDEYKAELNG